jgi:hypothetical protein
MAVENKYTDADVVAGKKAKQFVIGSGGDTFTLVGVISVASGDDDGSVYRVFANVPANAVPVSIEVHNTAITAGTDYDLGLYKTASGAVVDKDILADGVDLSAARTIATANNLGLTTLTLGELKTLATLSAQTNPDEAYDIAFTANTVGSAAGTIRVTATFVYA